MDNDNNQSEGQDIQLAKVAEAQAPATMNFGGGGLEPGTFQEVSLMADVILASGMGPKDMNHAGIIVAIQMGAELGLKPMQAIQNVAVINGRPSVWGDAALAVVMAHPDFDNEVFEEFIQRDDKENPVAATCIVGRKGSKAVTRTFTMKEAQTAKLLGKAGPWTQYPARMLQMRARGFAMRDAFPDALRGFQLVDRKTGAVIDGGPTAPTTTIEQETPPGNELADLTNRMREENDAPQDAESEEKEQGAWTSQEWTRRKCWRSCTTTREHRGLACSLRSGTRER
jgi:hypothetical protein